MRLIDAEHLKRWIMLRWESGVSVGYDDVKTNEIIEQIDRELTINPEPHWIPTSKERPPQHQEIWITSDLGGVELVYGRDDAWLADVDCYTESEIVAWMPANVPEPYRPEEEE